MATIPKIICLALSCCVATAIQAQGIPPDGTRKFGTITPAPDKDEKTVILDSELTTNLSIPEKTFVPCQASVSLAYYQRNTLARVESTIENKACKTGHGSFEISASINDADGQRHTLTFPETWEQTDSEKIVFSRDYPIGEDVELIRIRSTRVDCECRQ